MTEPRDVGTTALPSLCVDINVPGEALIYFRDPETRVAWLDPRSTLTTVERDEYARELVARWNNHDALVEALRAVEWSSVTEDYEGDDAEALIEIYSCPSCGERKGDGHHDACKVGSVLARIDQGRTA